MAGDEASGIHIGKCSTAHALCEVRYESRIELDIVLDYKIDLTIDYKFDLVIDHKIDFMIDFIADAWHVR